MQSIPRFLFRASSSLFVKATVEHLLLVKNRQTMQGLSSVSSTRRNSLRDLPTPNLTTDCNMLNSTARDDPVSNLVSNNVTTQHEAFDRVFANRNILDKNSPAALDNAEEPTLARPGNRRLSDQVATKALDLSLEELPKAEEDTQCTICFGREAEGVFMPCGHGGFCTPCAVEVFESHGLCPLCRKVDAN